MIKHLKDTSLLLEPLSALPPGVDPPFVLPT